MAGQTVALVKAYPIDNASGVNQYVCVVQGASDGSCKLPTAQNAPGFLGVTIEQQTNQNKAVAVCKSGLVRVTAGGTITRGDRLAINSTAGDVYSVEAAITAAPGTAKVFNVVGMAEVSAVSGDIFSMWIMPFLVSVAVS
jgi:hypothetical protein